MNALEDALYDKMSGNAGVAALVSTRIYREQAPQGAAYPLVVYGHQAGGDETLTSVDSVNVVYQVRAVSSVSAAEAGAIDEALRTALHRQTLTVTGWANFWTARINAIRFVETTPEGKAVFHAGGMYRIRLDKS